MFLKWLCLAAASSCWELVAASADCPAANVNKPLHGGVVLMQKGMALSQMKPQLEVEASEVAPDVDINAWFASVVNASSSTSAAYKDAMNKSGLSESDLSDRLVSHTEKSNVNRTFLYKHWSLVVAIAIVLACVGLICIVDRRWSAKQQAQEHDSNLAARTESFSMDLVRHLMPSAKIDQHQFRGLTRKSASITLGFDNVGLEIPGHGKVLDSVSGEFRAGRMTIILGPSGAGKTTFMNVLAGKATYGKMCGKVFVNGIESNLSEFKSVMGFVPQDDVVHEKLTVREQINFSAHLRNESGTDAATLCHIVDDVLAVLQIEHIQRSIVGGVSERGISGGQRKRVNIGLELAAFPTLLFLDEPTSGLDSTSSLALVKSLKKMTQLGITIVVVAHQPRWSLFSLFDDVLILAKGGHTCYLGPTQAVCPFFETIGFKKPDNENLADWLMDIVSGCVPNPKWPKFSSDLLVNSWAQRDKGADATAHRKLHREPTRAWTAHDDRAVLGQALEDEWAKVDTSRRGSLSLSELMLLLGNTAGELPSEEVTNDLATHMAGQGAKSVTKTQFVDYFVALEQVVTSTAKPYVDTTVGPGSAEELLTFPDLKRRQPGFCKQYLVLLRRRVIQVSRSNRQRTIDVANIMIISLFVGWLNRGSMTFRDPFFASKILVLHLGLALLITVSCLRTFGADRLVWWREFSSDMNKFAFFCARMTIDIMDVFLQCVLYTSMFYLVSQPETPFRAHFLPCLYLAIAASAWGYLISIVFPPENSSLVAILFMLVTNGFLGDPSAAGGYLSLLSITRWSAQMTYLMTADLEGSFMTGGGGLPAWVQSEVASVATKVPPNPLDVFKACGFMSAAAVEHGFRGSRVNEMVGHWYSASIVLITMAVVLRALAFLGMRFLNRSKYA
jgi:ABC-type multidrug transport system ATPase subunit/uncharacterized membrane protein HdeD (DUF308 family)